MKTTLGAPITAAISASFRRTRPNDAGQGPALVARGRFVVLILALLGAGLTGVARSQVVTEFSIPTSGSVPWGIAAGPDGNLWFTERDGNKIGRITPAGVVTEFSIPTSGSVPWGIAAGPDGNLWFTELAGNKIGTITAAGVVTEFSIPTADSGPSRITTGPDGNLWFTEVLNHEIARITLAGVVTEFAIPPAGSGPWDLATGPDGNLWFTYRKSSEPIGIVGRMTTAGAVTGNFGLGFFVSGGSIAAGPDGNLWFTVRSLVTNPRDRIGQITTAGDITQFPIPRYVSSDQGIATGPDGNLWFSEESGIGQITTAGVFTEFSTPAASGPLGIVAGPDGNLWFTENAANQIGRITTGPTTPRIMDVDARAATGSVSNANGVLEPGETVQIAPSWKNTLTDSETFTGTASNLTGPTGPTYTIEDSTADYGTIAGGARADCHGATGDCYLMTVSGTRPAAHWDATFTEDLSSNSISKVWTLHVGDSFPDVLTSNQFYSFIENLFHNGVTGGCAGGNYCPDSSVTRAQMAVFLMKGKLGSSEIPPPATGTVFNDVHVGDLFADWIEQLACFQITGGCGSGNYCPNNPVTRAQMAVFLLKAEHGSSYTPPHCAGIFPDVVCPSQFANWIEQLSNEGITGGCGGGNYCPDSSNTRGQMAAFLVKTFGLQLYGP